MSTEVPADDAQPALLDALAAIVGDDGLRYGNDADNWLAHDIFFWDNISAPACIVRPSGAQQVAELLQVARQFSRPVYSRGGGMSYSNAYGPTQPGSILFDLSALNSIREVDPTSRYIVVDSGCTWKQVVDAVAPHGMTVDFPAPLSGSHSTVGGALSQNVPGGMHGVLGVEVVLADGGIVRTGAWSLEDNPRPFCRDYGPDLTGLFLGDSGIFGVKTGVALHLKRKLDGAAYGSFAYETYEDMAATMIELAPYDFITRRTGFDPYETRNIAKVGLGDAIKTVLQVAAQEKNAVSGFKEAAKMAIEGRNFLKGVKWSFHIKVEGASERAAQDGLEIARRICVQRGRELPAILPRAREAVGFAIRKFLGKDGERWVTTSALWPIGRAVEIATAVQGFFAQRQAEMDRLGIVHSYITNFGHHYFLVEPCLYWRDELSPLHLQNLAPDEAARFAKFEANPETRATVIRIRHELRDFYRELGSIHVQIGEFYRFKDSLLPATRDLLERLKATLDPDVTLNPNKLDGIGSRRAN
jgi:FAD/FMN-containing dehydrogenase